MIVRQAQVFDAHAIQGIANTIISDTLVTFTTDLKSFEDIAADIRSKGARYLVAEAGGRVVGFATYGQFRSGPGYARSRELSINLAPAARGKGVGRALMARLESVARDDDVHVLVAGISAENPAALAFHTRLGFVEVGRMPEVGCKWGQWLDLVLMQKILAPD